jgi:hypothetical protein
MAVTQDGSFADIDIVRNIPIINRVMQIPPKNRNTVYTVIPSPTEGTRVVRLGATGGTSTAGWRHGVQEFMQLPPVNCQISSDPMYQTYVDLQVNGA